MEQRKYGVRFCCKRPAEQLEGWLRKNCSKSWNIKLSGMIEDDSGKLFKQLIVYFDNEQDCNIFKHYYFVH